MVRIYYISTTGDERKCSVPPGLDPRPLDHQAHSLHLGTGPVEHAPGYGPPLLGAQLHRALLQVQQQPALQHEEELVLLVVLVPVELSQEDAQADDGVVDLAEVEVCLLYTSPSPRD